MIKNLSPTGDTIIEVVLSMALLTSILLTAWGITNRSTQILAAARDRTVMVNAVKEQAEVVKALWATNKDYFTNATIYPPSTTFNANPCLDNSTEKWYVSVDDSTGQISSPPNQKQIGNDATKHVWIQKTDFVDSDPNKPTYSDFYIRACWRSSGGTQKDENTQLLLRLNT